MTPFDSSLWLRRPWEAGPRLAPCSGETDAALEAQFYTLKAKGELLGELQLTTLGQAACACSSAHQAWPDWDLMGFVERYQRLDNVLEKLQERTEALAQVAAIESELLAGPLAEQLQQAITWLRAHLAALSQSLNVPLQLAGPTGEANQLRLRGRGVWLLPVEEQSSLASVLQSAFLSLFCGNALLVYAKPKFSFCIARLVESCHEAGLPSGLVQFLPGELALKEQLLKAPELAGVIDLSSTLGSAGLAVRLAGREGALVAQVVMPEKAGSPAWASERLLLRFLCEQTVTANLTAVGGNAQLLSATQPRAG